MIQDLPNVLYWWLTLFGLGILVFPLTKRLFSKFFDFGYPFAKILAILLVSYLVWLLASFKILPFFRETVGLVIILLALLNFLILIKNKKHKETRSTIVDRVYGCLFKDGLIKILIFEEILFFLALLFWSFVRAHEPSIHGLEKFMDYGFINSILKSKFFPPHDIWLSSSPDPRYTGGFSINYYYFGHLTAAVLTKLSAIDSAITYNLVLANIFALCFTGAFSIGANLLWLSVNQQKTKGKLLENCPAKRDPALREKLVIFGGLLTAFLVTLAGNLHTIYVFLKDSSRYWYPDATRFIPFTIHEFPLYSWVVADLHGHVFDIPFVLLTIAMLIALLNSKFETLSSKQIQNTKYKIQNCFGHLNLKNWNLFRNSDFGFRILLLGLVLAVLYITNALDGLVYLGLSGLVILAVHLSTNHEVAKVTKVRGSNLKSKILKLVICYLLLFICFFLFSLPFNLNFHPFVKSIGVNCPPSFMPDKWGPFIFEKANCQRSPLYMLAILWGFFFFNAMAFLLYLFKKSQAPSTKPRRLKIENWKLKIVPRSGIPLCGRNLRKVDVFIVLMIILSTSLLIFPEFFYFKDIYPGHFRANTMFKLGYQAFMMMSIASGYIIIRFAKKIKNQSASWRTKTKNTNLKILKFLRFAFLIFLIPQLFLVSIYPYYAINSYYDHFKTYHGLDGAEWLKNQYPDDYQAISWLKDHVPVTTSHLPVIAEAVGESYTDYARVSAYTGLPTIIGWPVHEWLWRGSYDEAGARIPEVQTIYESKDLESTKSLLEKYNVSYVFLGTLEREKYKELNEEKFEELGKVVFESGRTRIFEIN